MVGPVGRVGGFRKLDRMGWVSCERMGWVLTKVKS